MASCSELLLSFRLGTYRYCAGNIKSAVGLDPLGGGIAMITLHTLAFGYQDHAPLGTLSGSFSAGSLTAIMGENGSGKSTLLKTLAGLLAPLSGKLNIDPCAQPMIGYLPQLSEFDRQFPLSVNDLVLMGCLPHRGLFGTIPRAWHNKAQTALQAVGMTGFAHRPIGHLSGGQLQRVLFARLLLTEAPVLLLDEPFTGVDAETTQALLTLIRQRHAQGCTILAVLHDQGIVEQHFPLVLQLNNTGHRWGNTAQILASTCPACSPAPAWVKVAG